MNAVTLNIAPIEDLRPLVEHYYKDPEFRAAFIEDPKSTVAAYVGEVSLSDEVRESLLGLFETMPTHAADASMQALATVVGCDPGIQNAAESDPTGFPALVAWAFAVGVVNLGWAANAATIVNAGGTAPTSRYEFGPRDRIVLAPEYYGSDAEQLLTGFNLSAGRQVALLKRAVQDGEEGPDGSRIYDFEGHPLQVRFSRDAETISIQEVVLV